MPGGLCSADDHCASGACVGGFCCKQSIGNRCNNQGTCDAGGDCVCGAGYFAPAAGATCEVCAIGTFSAGSSSSGTLCDQCAPGHVSPQVGASQCSECDAGKHATATVAGCVACSNGTFAAISGMGQCQDCAIGRASYGEGKTACVACASGFIAEATGSAECEQCAPGKHSLLASASNACDSCDAGKFLNEPGHLCKACSPGTYSQNDGATACVACDAGTFQSQTSQTSCEACAPAHVQTSTGAASCDACPDHHKANDERTLCIDCGISRTGVECELCRTGFFGKHCDKCSDSIECSGHGTCRDEDNDGNSWTCDCAADYTTKGTRPMCDRKKVGIQCQADAECLYDNCPAVLNPMEQPELGVTASHCCSAASGNCNGHGACGAGAGQCSCYGGYDIASNCSSCVSATHFATACNPSSQNCPQCEAKRDLGGSCGASEMCSSGFCVDSACCSVSDCLYGECSTGSCRCREGFAAAKCDECAENHYTYPICARCVAQEHCSGHGTCESISTGVKCACEEGYTSAACDQCVTSTHYADGTGKCLPKLASPETCSFKEMCISDFCDGGACCDVASCPMSNANCRSGTCKCNEGFAGADCLICAPNHFGATCQACSRDTCSGHGSCGDSSAPNGGYICVCDGGYEGQLCAKLSPGEACSQDAQCTNACRSKCCKAEAGGCSAHGTCDDAGDCACDHGYAGVQCDSCASGYYDPAWKSLPNAGSLPSIPRDGLPAWQAFVSSINHNVSACSMKHGNGETGQWELDCASNHCIDGVCCEVSGCSGHGSCASGSCACDAGYRGPACSIDGTCSVLSHLDLPIFNSAEALVPRDGGNTAQTSEINKTAEFSTSPFGGWELVGRRHRNLTNSDRRKYLNATAHLEIVDAQQNYAAAAWYANRVPLTSGFSLSVAAFFGGDCKKDASNCQEYGCSRKCST